MSAAKGIPRLVVDGTRCDGHRICARLFEERVGLDQWGYAVVDAATLDSDRLLARARRAVAACPAGALAINGDG